MSRDRFVSWSVPLVSAVLATLGAPSARAQTPAGVPQQQPTGAPQQQPAEPQVAALTEAEIVARAKAQNPGLAASVLEVERAQWAVVEAEAQYAFVLQLDGGVTRTATPRLGATGVITDESYSADTGAELRRALLWGTQLSFRLAGRWDFTPASSTVPDDIGPGYGLSARFSVVQPFLRGAGREVGESQLLISQASRMLAERTRDSAASGLLVNVVTAYWELWYANAAFQIQKQSQAVAKGQRDDAAARAKGGSLAPADVLSFETRVATSEEDVLGAETERQRRQAELAQQLGELGKGPAIGLPSETVPPMPPPPPADAEEAALAASTQLQQEQASLELARVQARTAGDAQRARLDLDAYVQAQGLGNDAVGPAFKQLGRLGAVSAHVGLTYEAPLDGRRQQAEAARARLDVDIATQRLAEARQSVLSALRIALARDAAGRSKLVLVEQTVELAEKQLAAEKARYQTGASTPLAIIVAEDAVRSAQLRVARARADLVEANLSLQNLMGRLLARYADLKRGGHTPAVGQMAPTVAAFKPMRGAF